MIRESVQALLACVATFALCAVGYPLVVYGIGHTLFPRQAEGSLIRSGDKVIGSELIAQPFASAKYFAPRPSAVNYAADAAGGSNLATTNSALRDRIAADSARLGGSAPVDLLAASGSGLDPHISPESARFQAPRVASARGISVDQVTAKIDAHTDRSGSMIGAPARVNVLLLNLDLDGPTNP